MKHFKSALVLAVASVSSLAGGAAMADTGKLLLTGGVSSIDGAAGGGLTPWATIGTNATDGEIGASAFVSRATSQDYSLNVVGAALGYKDRFEVSIARQDFGVQPGQKIKMDILGLKLRVAGDAVLDSDTLMPQIAVGLQYKNVDPGSIGSVLKFLDAKTQGTDFYVSATKLFLAPRFAGEWHPALHPCQSKRPAGLWCRVTGQRQSQLGT